jgi:hypothetical protein
LPSGSIYKPTGKIAFFGNQVNAQTGTANIYADFPNPDHLLLPGTLPENASRRTTGAAARSEPALIRPCVRGSCPGDFTGKFKPKPVPAVAINTPPSQ